MPLYWCVFWYILALPVVAYGAYKMNKLIKANRDVLPLLAVSGAFIFVLSSLKMPSVTGSCSILLEQAWEQYSSGHGLLRFYQS